MARHVAKLFPQDQDFADVKFTRGKDNAGRNDTRADLSEIFRDFESNDTWTAKQEKMFAVMAYHLGHGGVGDLKYDPEQKVFKNSQKVGDILTNWMKNVY